MGGDDQANNCKQEVKREPEEIIFKEEPLEEYEIEIQRKIKVEKEIHEESLLIDVVEGLIYEDYSTHSSSDIEKISDGSSSRCSSKIDCDFTICKKETSFVNLNFLEHKNESNCKNNSTRENSNKIKEDLLEGQNSCCNSPNTFKNLWGENSKQINPSSFSCGQSCTQFPKQKSKFNKSCVSAPKVFTCGTFDKSFNTNSHLNRHILTHSNICDKSFERNISHSEEQPFVCAICNNSFKSNSEFMQHKKFHSVDKVFICEICDKGFNRKFNMKEHMLTHSDEEPFVCEICEKPFKRKTHLKDHMKVHSDVKPFVCEICEKAFKRKTHLMEHILTHYDAKPFMCEICCKFFKRRDYLTSHKSLHSDETPFACVICGKCFKVKGALQKHIKKYHY